MEAKQLRVKARKVVCGQIDSDSEDETPHNNPRSRLDDNTIGRLRVGKYVQHHDDPVTSMSFSLSGMSLVTAGQDDQLVVYNSPNGTKRQRLYCKKYGIGMIRYTRQTGTVIHSSTRINHTIRHLAINDNRYLQYFCGHSKRVTSLSVSPVNDTFLSASLDKTVRLWDLRSRKCQGRVNCYGNPVAALDSNGLTFATGVNNERISLYDLRTFDKGPFLTFPEYGTKYDWKSLKYSPDGSTIMICSSGPELYFFNAFSGVPGETLSGHRNRRKLHLQASFSQDSKFVFCGSEDGKVHGWKVGSGKKILELDGGHKGPVLCVDFCPSLFMMVTSCKNTVV